MSHNTTITLTGQELEALDNLDIRKVIDKALQSQVDSFKEESANMTSSSIQDYIDLATNYQALIGGLESLGHKLELASQS